MVDSLNSSWGAIAFPVPVPSGLDLADIDPARDILLDLFAAAITSECSDAFEIAAIGVGELTAVVGDKLPALDDIENLRQRKCKFPLLSVARSNEPNQENEFTLWQNQITSRWTIDYVLGPLEIGNRIKLGDLLPVVGRVIAATIRRGGHKAYAKTTLVTPTVGDPITAAKQVFGRGAGCCGFSTVGIVSFACGAAAFSEGGPKYHAMTMTLVTTELDAPAAENASDYGGAAVAIDGGPVINLDTSVPYQPPLYQEP